MRALLFVLVLVALSGQAYAAATIADIYSAPSEAEKYYAGVGVACQNLDPNCSDIQFASVLDSYSILGDGSTASASSITIENKSSTQSGFFKFVFHTDGVLSGTYKLRVGHKAGQGSYIGKICPYLNITHLNVSACFSVNDGDGGQWHEFTIPSSIVERGVSRFDGAVILRFMQTSGSAADVAEAYLKRPFKLSDISIVPQGVSEAESGTRIENTWNIISPSGVPPLTNVSCEVQRLTNITDAGHELMNISLLNVEYDLASDNSYIKVYWDVNESAGIVEGFNYELECSGYIGELYLNKFSQFVYVNRAKSLWENIADFISYFLQIIGLLEDNQALINESIIIGNETRDIANQTLNIVQGLGGAVSVQPQDIVAYTGQNLTVMAALTVGVLPDDAADCKLRVYYPNATIWISEQNMTSIGADGLYKTNVLFPEVTGNYQAISSCTGGSLSGSARGLASWEVSSGVRMQSIT